MTTNQTLSCTRNLRLLHEHRVHLERYSALGPKTINARIIQVRRLIDFMGELCVLDLNEEHLWKFRKILNKLRVRTRVDTLKATREFLLQIANRHPKEARFQARYADLLIPKRNEEQQSNIKRPVTFPTEREITTVVSTLLKQSDPVALRDAAIISLMSASGVRIGSLITLRGKDLVLNATQRTLNMDPTEVDTKFDKFIEGRVFKFAEVFDEAIERYLEWRQTGLGFGPKDPLFTHSKTLVPGSSKVVLSTKPWTNTGAPSRIVSQRFRESGIGSFSAHKMRHAAAAMGFRRASSAYEIKAVSQVFGHSTVQTLMSSYGDLSQKELDAFTFTLGKSSYSDLSPLERDVIAAMRSRVGDEAI